MSITTWHTYPDLVHRGGRLAATEWDGNPTAAQAVEATLRLDQDAIVLRVCQLRGLAPGGIGV
jgi:hypothetical protein